MSQTQVLPRIDNQCIQSGTSPCFKGFTQGRPMSPIWNNTLFLRLHAWTITKLKSSKAWTIPEYNPEQLLVFKAPPVRCKTLVDESDEQVGCEPYFRHCLCHPEKKHWRGNRHKLTSDYQTNSAQRGKVDETAKKIIKNLDFLFLTAMAYEPYSSVFAKGI